MTDKKTKNSHVCPYWLIWTFDNPIRRIVHNPEKMLSGLVNPGDIVLDLGCGAGFFTIGLARLAGPEGRVIAVDLQPEMLVKVEKRAQKAGLHVYTHQPQPDQIGLKGPVDFALAFWMVHEVPNQQDFLSEVYRMLRLGGQLLVAEPMIHVNEKAFSKTCALAKDIGFELLPPPVVGFSWAVLLRK